MTLIIFFCLGFLVGMICTIAGIYGAGIYAMNHPKIAANLMGKMVRRTMSGGK